MTFPSSTPSAQGIEPAGLLAFVDALDAHPAIEPHGLIVQRHGHRVLEAYWAPHRAGQLRHVYSLSKTFTGTALGLAIGEGRLGLDDLAADHLPDLIPAGADERTRRTTVKHLATMASGHEQEMLLDALVADPEDPLRGFFTLPPTQEPGTVFAYNQPPVLAVATILQRLAGERLVDYLRPRLLDPIGIGDLRWQEHSPGIDLGFAGVNADLDAIARLGQLYVDDGMWEGRRVLPEGWVAEAAQPHTPNPNEPTVDWQQGYGIQLWMCQHGYRGDGAYGQYLVMLPEQDAVVAFVSHTEPMQPVLDLLWDVLLPAMGDAPVTAVGATDGDAAIAERVAGLEQPTAADRVAAAQAAGADWGKGTFDRATDGPCHLTLKGAEVADGHLLLEERDGTLRIPLSADWTDVPGQPMATSAAIDGDGRVHVDVVLLATPHRLELVLDPASATFTSRWPLPPLFGIGNGPHLHRMVPPA